MLITVFCPHSLTFIHRLLYREPNSIIAQVIFLAELLYLPNFTNVLAKKRVFSCFPKTFEYDLGQRYEDCVNNLWPACISHRTPGGDVLSIYSRATC